MKAATATFESCNMYTHCIAIWLAIS